jgi:hypothetical protein
MDRVSRDVRLTSGCKVWLVGVIARRSDDFGRRVWGTQARMGVELGRSERSVRRYVVEAEQLGYLRVYRAQAERDLATGRWFRKQSNTYWIALPAKDTVRLVAPRRRQRAGYCIVRPPRLRVSHLPDSDGRSTPDRGVQTATPPPAGNSTPSEHPKSAWTGEITDVVTTAIAQAKAHLAASQVGLGYRRRSIPASLPPLRT